MVDVFEISAIVAAAGVLVCVVYYVSTRNTIELCSIMFKSRAWLAYCLSKAKGEKKSEDSFSENYLWTDDRYRSSWVCSSL
jgi:hypothetical protein